MDIEVKDGRAYITTKRWCECGGTAACDTQLCPRCAYDTLSERLRGRIAVGDKNGRRLWEGCWEWKGKLRSTGYGQTKIEGKFWSSHRLVYSLLRGHLSEELVLDHLCRNRACCNPWHLRQVTIAENVLAPGSQSITALNAAKTHCHRGHDITGDGAYKTKDGRACKVCKRQSMKDYYQRKKAS